MVILSRTEKHWGTAMVALYPTDWYDNRIVMTNNSPV
jgi:hypothetical protein